MDLTDITRSDLNLARIVRTNMCRALETSDLTLDEIAASANVALNELGSELLVGGRRTLAIDDAYRVYLVLYPDNPLRFHEWFEPPLDEAQAGDREHGRHTRMSDASAPSTPGSDP